MVEGSTHFRVRTWSQRSPALVGHSCHFWELLSFLRNICWMWNLSICFRCILEGISDLNNAARSTRDRALYIDQLTSIVNLVYLQLLHGPVLAAHATWHLFPWPDSPWVLTSTDSSWTSMGLGITVTSRLFAKAPSFDASLESFTF